MLSPPPSDDIDTNSYEYKQWLYSLWQSTLASSNSSYSGSNNSDLIGFLQAGVGAGLRSVQSRLRDTIDLADFYANGISGAPVDNTGVIDSTLGIQAALNTGQIIRAKAGDYLFSTLTLNSSGGGIIGDGYKTRFLSNSLTGDIFLVGNAGATTTGYLFADFRVWATVTKTSGYVFNCIQTTNSLWRNVFCGSLNDYVANGNSHRLWDGFYFDRFGENSILGAECTVAQTGVKARGNSNQSFGAELTIDGGYRIYAAAKGVWLGGAAGGVYLGRMDASVCGYGVYVDTTLQTGIYNRELFMGSFCTIDSCTNWGLNIEDKGLAFLEVTGTWFSGNGNVGTNAGGIRIAPTTGQVLSAKWTGIRLKSNYADGLQASQGNHVMVGGFCSNNGAAAGGANGLNFAAFGGLIINGMQIDNNGNSTSGFGLIIGGLQNNYNIQGNYFFSNGPGFTKNISDISGAADQTHMIRGNIGYVTEDNGIALIANGTAAVVVTHKLSASPSLILVQWSGSPDASGVFCQPADYTTSATTFTIRTNGNVTALRSVAWSAVRGSQ